MTGHTTEVGENGAEQSEFADIPQERLEEVADNIRIDSPEGEIPLSSLMLDIVLAHSELNQQKSGALTLYSNLTERLEEEQERNPDSEECEVIKSVQESVWKLYMRLEKGDEYIEGGEVEPPEDVLNEE